MRNPTGPSRVLVSLLVTLGMLVAVIPAGASSHVDVVSEGPRPSLEGVAVAAPDTDQITICHAPGTPAEGTIDVGEAALPDHLAHGDTVGTCVPPQDTIPYVCSPSGVEYVTLYVRSGTEGAQKGTIEKPFRSVSSALAYAEKNALPAVELQVAPGTYAPEALVISRHTRIVGPATGAGVGVELAVSITNEGPHELGVQGVVVVSNDAAPAVTVAHPEASTGLCDVRFDGTVGHAFSQVGGSLSAEQLQFNSTRREPGVDDLNHQTGSALLLSGGVVAELAQIRITDSAGSGLQAVGSGTSVTMDWDASTASSITGGSGCDGAVVIADGAAFASKWLLVADNKLYGVRVDGAATQAEFQHLTVTGTQEVEACGPLAWINLLITGGPQVTVTGTTEDPFVLSDSFVSLGAVGSGADTAQIDLANGIISDNEIGVNVADIAFATALFEYWGLINLECGETPPGTYNNVLLLNNAVNLDSPILPVPNPCPS